MYIELGALLCIALLVGVYVVGTIITLLVMIKHLRPQPTTSPKTTKETTEIWTDQSGVWPIRRKKPELTLVGDDDSGTAA